jgi:hypothetical protein
MKITKKEFENVDHYNKCKSKQLGNLHERMRYVMELLADCESESKMSVELWNAIADLELEVQFHEPKNPPIAKRNIK